MVVDWNATSMSSVTKHANPMAASASALRITSLVAAELDPRRRAAHLERPVRVACRGGEGVLVQRGGGGALGVPLPSSIVVTAADVEGVFLMRRDHDAGGLVALRDRKSTRLHPWHLVISYGVLCLQHTRMSQLVCN